MFSRTEVGQVRTWKSHTKNAQHYTWSKQQFNVFEQERSNVLGENSAAGNAQNDFKSSTRVHDIPGGKSQVSFIFGGSENASNTPVKSSTKVFTKSSTNIFAPPSPAEARTSTRVHAIPGGESNMSSIISGTNCDVTDVKTSKGFVRSMSSTNIFSNEPVVMKASTKRIAVPGGQSDMSNIMSHQCPPPHPTGFKTGKMNESHNVVNLTPKSEKYSSHLRSYKANESNNIVNLTPAPMKRSTSRTAKMNEQCTTEQEGKVLPERFSTRNQMLSSDIFAQAENMEGYQSSTRVHHAPGGASNGNIISWN